MTEIYLMKWPPGDRQWTLLMIRHRGSGNGLIGAVMQQAIIWANVEPHLFKSRQMASLGRNELKDAAPWAPFH